MTREAGTAACAPATRGISGGTPLRAARGAAAFLAAALFGWATPAGAQVTIDLHALDALPAEVARQAPGPAAPRARPHRARKIAKVETPTHAPATTAAAKPASATAGNPAPAQVAVAPEAAAPHSAPAAPPASVASLPTIAAAPPPAATVASVPAEPPPPAVQASAPAAPVLPKRTLHISFAPGQSELTPPETSALVGLAHATPRTDTTSFEVAAYAAAAGGDASSARRLSLARALAVRTALVGAGVPAGSIYMRALGAPPAGEADEANRAIVTIMGANGSSAAPEQAKQP